MPPPDKHDYYALLEVTATASATEIRAAHKRILIKVHPDVNPNVDPTLAARVNAAYEVLSDPAKRKTYDQQRRRVIPTAATRPPMDPRRDVGQAARPTARRQAGPAERKPPGETAKEREARLEAQERKQAAEREAQAARLVEARREREAERAQREKEAQARAAVRRQVEERAREAAAEAERREQAIAAAKEQAREALRVQVMTINARRKARHQRRSPAGPHAASVQQQAIFDWVRSGTGNGLIVAVAGSGKTTTLVEASRHLGPGSALFCAFNKHIQETLESRLHGRMMCRTMHSLGLAALSRALPKSIEVDDDKIWKLTSEAITSAFRGKRRGGDPGAFVRWLVATRDAVHYAKVTLTAVREIDGLASLVAAYRLDVATRDLEWWHPIVRTILREDARLAKEQGVIDYDDMLWLPHFFRLPLPQYDWVFVDECQDLSAAQLDLVARSLMPDGRLLAVGDPRQAIYGFAGADAGSIGRLRERFAPTDMPLSVTYRCPTDVVRLAQWFAPQIRAWEHASPGESMSITAPVFRELISEGDLVLSRKTAPLIECCLDLLAQKKPARVKGRGIGKELLDHLAKLHDPVPYSAAALSDALDAYGTRELERLESQINSAGRIQELIDQLDAIHICIQAFPEATNLAMLKGSIQKLFSDTAAPIMLSTVHRAKGLEAERVFLIAPEDLPLSWPGQQQWELEQELNLKYVAITRAKESLFWVTASPKSVEELAKHGLDFEASPAPPPVVSMPVDAPVTPTVRRRGKPELSDETPWGVGQWVEHPRFGRGVVVKVTVSPPLTGAGSTLILDVSFAGDRIRKLVPDVAQLTRVQ